MKKFLSLVLALVMTMSLVTVSAGAVDFTDDSDIDYKEAVDVISALGIVDGYTDDSFRPDGALTRGAAAKIICNLILGPTTASALSATTAPFRDVPVTNTFAGYITYCSQQGIINGYGDGTFRPTGALTGNAFLKMLLGALGYDSSIEGYSGANWQVNVIKQATGIGLDDGNDNFVGSNTVTRQEAALYAFNMLQADMVQYDAKTTVNVNGATVTVAGDQYKVVSEANGWIGTNDGQIGAADGVQQFAERYFDRLVLRSSVDDFSRPSNVWTYNGVKVGTYPKAADATYSADVSLGTIYADLGMNQADNEAEVYVDGLQADELVRVNRNNDLKLSAVVFDEDVSSTASGSLRFCQVGNGTLVEAYRNSKTNDVTIVAINTYVAEVNRVVAASGNKAAYITLSELDTEKGSGYTSEMRNTDEFETEGFATDDVVLFTYSKSADEIKSVVAAESVTGELARRELTKNLTIGENKYSYSNKYSVDGGEADLSVGSEYEVYLDAYGYAIYALETEYNIQDYAFLRALQSGAGVFASDKAALRTYEGKGLSVDLARDYLNEDSNFASYPDGNPATDQAEIGDAVAKIVLARQNSEGDYRLKALHTYNYSSAAGAANGFDMRNGVARITLDTTPSASQVGTIFADDRTQVVLGRIDAVTDAVSWTSYSGTANMPTITHKGGALPEDIGVSFYSRNGGVATIIYILVDEANYNVVAGNNSVIFFSPESASGYVEDANNFGYYTFSGVVNGEIVNNLQVEATLANSTILRYNRNGFSTSTGMPTISGFDLAFTNAEYDDGVIVDWDRVRDNGADGAMVAKGVNKLSNGNIQVGYNQGNDTYGNAHERTYVVARDVKVFFMNDDGVITEGSMSGVRRDENAIVTYVLEDGQITYLFVQEYYNDNESGTIPQGPSNVTSLSTASYANGTGVLSFQVNGTDVANRTYTVTIQSIIGGVTNTIVEETVTTNASGVATKAIATNLLPDLSTFGGVYVVRFGNASTVISVSA